MSEGKAKAKPVYVEVCDLVIVKRKVRIPRRCPHCDGSLRKEGALTEYEYQSQSRAATATNEGAIEYGDDFPGGGEGFISIEWHCSECGGIIAGNREVQLDADGEGMSAG